MYRETYTYSTQKSTLINSLQLSGYLRVVDGETFGVRRIGDCLEEICHVRIEIISRFLHVGNEKKNKMKTS
jgi:hypothetical protein